MFNFTGLAADGAEYCGDQLRDDVAGVGRRTNLRTYSQEYLLADGDVGVEGVHAGG